MRKLLWGVVAIAFAALVAWAYYVISNHQYYPVTNPIPFKGEARKNPLYASRLFLKQMGIPTMTIESLQGITEYPDYDTVIVLDNRREAYLDNQLIDLLTWVEEGGHLIVNSYPDWDYIYEEGEEEDEEENEDNEEGDLAEANSEPEKDKPQANQCEASDDNEQSANEDENIESCDDEALDERMSDDYIQQELDIYTHKKVYLDSEDKLNESTSKEFDDELFENITIEVDALDLYNIKLLGGMEKTLALQSDFLAIQSPYEEEYKVIIEDHLFMFERQYGDGLITLASDLSFIENELIRYADNAEIFWHLIHDYHEKPAEVWLIHRTQMPSILMLMWQKGSPVVISLALLLLAWMYRVAQRFGPVIDKQKPQRRELMEHIQASGRYHWQHKNQSRLIESTRQALIRRINQLHPVWHQNSIDEKSQYLSDMLQQDQAELHQLLFGDYETLSADEFTDVIQQLEAIRRQL